jgi:hypothetical protein
MGLYTNWKYNDPNHVPAIADQGAWPNSVGGRIMQAPALVGININTLPGMTALVNEFQNIGWAWDPSIAGRTAESGKTLLDRQIAGRGECGFLAAALHILLKTPPPYGFGQAGSDIRVYSGKAGADNGANDIQGDGFVAQHNGLPHGISPNVCQYDPVGNPVPLQNLYKWGDHCVVEYAVLGNTYFWDPSYNTRFNAITDMALHRIAATQVIVQNNVPSQHLRLNNNHWLRNRLGTEVNYNPFCIYLMSTNNNQVPMPAIVLPQQPHRIRMDCCTIL